MYVSIQSFSINRVNNKWNCRFFLQAHKSREDKINGFPGFFLSYWVQTSEIEILDLSNILSEIYAKAKTLFGEELCTDVLDDSKSELPPTEAASMSAVVPSTEPVQNDSSTA